jgi:hypothetical protein
MATSERDIDDFSQFAKSRLKNGGSELSLEELLDEWMIKNPPQEDTLAVQASIRDMQNGETGQAFDDFAREFRQRNGLCDPE